MKQWNNETIENGMTLIEVLIITSLVAILSGIVFFNYRASQSQFALQRSAYKLAQDIRRGKYLALNTKEFEGDIPDGYGVYIRPSFYDSSYIIYADQNGNRRYEGSPPDGTVETSYLEEGIYLKNLRVKVLGVWMSINQASINFSPPDPEVSIRGPMGLIDFSEAKIELAQRSDPNKTKGIIVNRLGLVTVE